MSDPTTQLIETLTREIIRRPAVKITADTPLVSSGLIDSFRLIDVIMALEDITGAEIPSGRVQPLDFETVAGMLALAERFKK